ncbi:ATP dependent DNA ligase [Streptomyces griseosporeus]|uniref:ATP dependent DNA ligase n=1 Tax=Streptomyces griseosporeus TaxID=1910 RepID=UPI0036CE8F7B
MRETAEGIVGAVTGPLARPRTLLLGRYDAGGQLAYVGRTTTLPRTAGALAELLTAAAPGHPWAGWSFSAGWGSRETLHVTLVEPELVVEVGVEVARDASGRLRHPARWHRIRAEMHPLPVPKFGEGDEPSADDNRHEQP